MKGNNAVRIWRSFVVAAAGLPRMPAEREPEEERDEATPAPPLTGYSLAWDPYEVWLKRVKEPRDRRDPKSAPR